MADRSVSVWREKRERYAPRATELPAEMKLAMLPFFPARLLEEIRFVQLRGDSIEFPKAKPREPADFPFWEHAHGHLFLDVLVMNRRLTERQLFHSLVHAMQMRRLGPERYVQTYLRALARTESRLGVPFEIQAFNLEARYATAPGEGFAVEDQVEMWVRKKLY
ncbi:MAG TPA: hypothetical protein VMJ93_15930 [Verrucomicrobiae bacterium]|nr:hypothetical protein [Verrucomicrobiae bacterium]